MEAIYKIYDLRKYYPDFIGANPIAIVSNLPEAELLLKCPELQQRVPFVYFDREKWKAFRKAQIIYCKNNDKFRKRMQFLEENYGYEEGVSELAAADLDDEDTLDIIIKRISVEHLREVLNMIPETQSRRILLYYSGYTYAEIAQTENVSFQVVHRSIKKAMKNIIRNF